MLKHVLRDRRLRALLTLTVLLVAFSSYAALAAGSKTVKVGDFFFNPHKLTIAKGTKVTWNWTGAIKHNVTVKSGPAKFHSRTQLHGLYSHTFTRKGTYKLVCTIHPIMKLTIVVK